MGSLSNSWRGKNPYLPLEIGRTLYHFSHLTLRSPPEEQAGALIGSVESWTECFLWASAISVRQAELQIPEYVSELMLYVQLWNLITSSADIGITGEECQLEFCEVEVSFDSSFATRSNANKQRFIDGFMVARWQGCEVLERPCLFRCSCKRNGLSTTLKTTTGTMCLALQQRTVPSMLNHRFSPEECSSSEWWRSSAANNRGRTLGLNALRNMLSAWSTNSTNGKVLD